MKFKYKDQIVDASCKDEAIKKIASSIYPYGVVNIHASEEFMPSGAFNYAEAFKTLTTIMLKHSWKVCGRSDNKIAFSCRGFKINVTIYDLDKDKKPIWNISFLYKETSIDKHIELSSDKLEEFAETVSKLGNFIKD